MFRRRFLMAAIVAGIATLAGPATSGAAFTVTITSGANTLTIVDGDGNDSNGTAGRIDFDNALLFGAFDIEVSASTNSPGGFIPGFGPAGRISSNTLNVVSNGSLTTLTIETFSDGFSIFDVNDNVTVLNRLSASALDGGATATGVTELISATPSTTPVASLNDVGFNQTSMNAVLNSDPFAIRNTMTLNNLVSNAEQNVTLTSTVVVPAPAGLILAATALPFVGLLRRRLRRPEATTAA